MKATATFDCDRSCHRWQECKFSPVLLGIGRTYVHSHTTKVVAEFRDRDAFARAAKAIGGTVIGEGTHSLYSSKETGFAVSLPDWSYPIVAHEDGSIAFDSYNGAWGDADDIKKLTGRYAVEAARGAATAQGWMSQDNTDGSLTVFHPSGGSLTVQESGTVDAANFIGSGCAEAGAIIESAIGRTGEISYKPEFFAAKAQVQNTEGDN